MDVDMGVSILYEANGLCDLPLPLHDQVRRAKVSILYEANGLCDEKLVNIFNPFVFFVSILYEANGLCDSSRGRRGSVTPVRRFNPLRGKRALRLPAAGGSWGPGRQFQSSTRQTGFATLAFVMGEYRHLQFQSSTRQTGFATHGGEVMRKNLVKVSILYEANGLCDSPALVRRAAAVKGFNPLRGKRALRPVELTGMDLHEPH